MRTERSATDGPTSGPDVAPRERLRAASLSVLVDNQAPSGAFPACPTFGEYRYCWFRDGAYIAHALLLAGEDERAVRFHRWAAGVILRNAPAVERTVARAEVGLAPEAGDIVDARYRLDGTAAGDGWPNFQLDGLGTWLWSLSERQALTHGALEGDLAAAASLASRYLASLWRLPSYDCWEEHGDKVNVSTLAAIQCGLRSAAELLGDGDVAKTASVVRDFVLVNGTVGGRLRKHLDTDVVDANLVFAGTPYRLLEPDDPIMEATVEELSTTLRGPNGGLYRYRGDTYYGGGEWPLLSAHLGWHRAEAGDLEGASAELAWVESQADDDGELAEQISTGAQHPPEVTTWTARWGRVAVPLLWSHAAYLILDAAIEAGRAASTAR